MPFRARMARTSLEIIVFFKGYKLITYVRERLRLIVLRFFLFFSVFVKFPLSFYGVAVAVPIFDVKKNCEKLHRILCFLKVIG